LRGKEVTVIFLQLFFYIDSMQRVALLNWENISQDYDLAKVFQSLATSWVVEWLEVQTWKVTAGYGFIDVTRDSETFPVLFQNTAELVIDTTWTKKVFIEITQSNIDDWINNNSNWTWIWEIKTAVSYPTSNYIKLASIDAWLITDEREKVWFALRNLNWDYTLLELKNTDIFRVLTNWQTLWKMEASDFLLNGVWVWQALWLLPLDVNWKIDPSFIPATWNTVQYIAWESISAWDKINWDIQNNGRAIFLWGNIEVFKTTWTTILWVAKSDYVIWDVVEIMTDVEWEDFLTWDMSDWDLITNPWDNIVLDTNRIYNYNNINISNWSSITTNATTGFIFIKTKWNILIEWDINFSEKIDIFETNMLWIWDLTISPWTAWNGGSWWNGWNWWYHSTYWSAWTRWTWWTQLNGYWWGWWGWAHWSWANGTVRTSWNWGNWWSPAWLWWTNSTNSNWWNSSWWAWLWKFSTSGYAWWNAYSNNWAYWSGSWSWWGWWAWWQAWKSWVSLVIIHKNIVTWVGSILANWGNWTNWWNAWNWWSYSWWSGTNVWYSSGGWGGGWGWAWWGWGWWKILLIWPTTSLTVTTSLNWWSTWLAWNWWSWGIPYNFNWQVGWSAWFNGGNWTSWGNWSITYKPISDILDLYKPTY